MGLDAQTDIKTLLSPTFAYDPTYLFAICNDAS